MLGATACTEPETDVVVDSAPASIAEWLARDERQLIA
jgi:hypothetical protein